MKIIDLHCDTILQFLRGKSIIDGNNTHVTLEKLQRGDWMAQCFAIFVPYANPESTNGIEGTATDYIELTYKAFQTELSRCNGALKQVRSVAELKNAQESGQIGAILTIENCVSLDGDLNRFDDYVSKGVKMASLVWNYENSLAYPNSSDPDTHSKGLKSFGFDCVQRMNELGIAVDVSHLNEGGFWDVAKTSTKPFIASHSCARELCNHPRNLTDEQLRALGNAGGVVGVNYCAPFLREDEPKDGRSSLEDVVRHIHHMINSAGEDAVALGSDYDGISCTLEWGDAGGQSMLTQLLEQHFTPSQIEKICWNNALRVFTDIWKD